MRPVRPNRPLWCFILHCAAGRAVQKPIQARLSSMDLQLLPLMERWLTRVLPYSLRPDKGIVRLVRLGRPLSLDFHGEASQVVVPVCNIAKPARQVPGKRAPA